jgi:hypothetical protein
MKTQRIAACWCWEFVACAAAVLPAGQAAELKKATWAAGIAARAGSRISFSWSCGRRWTVEQICGPLGEVAASQSGLVERKADVVSPKEEEGLPVDMVFEGSLTGKDRERWPNGDPARQAGAVTERKMLRNGKANALFNGKDLSDGRRAEMGN